MREDLKNYKYNQKWIQGRLEYLQEYKSTIDNISATLSDMPHGSRKVQDNIAEKIANLYESIESLLESINKQQEKQEEILKQLDEVEQPYKLILEKHYIQGKSLVTVASEMNYNYEYTKRMNGIALNKFDEIGEMK